MSHETTIRQCEQERSTSRYESSRSRGGAVLLPLAYNTQRMMMMTAQAHSISATQVACQPCMARLHAYGAIRDGQISFTEKTRWANRYGMATIHMIAVARNPKHRDRHSDFHLMMDGSAEFLCAFLRTMRYTSNGDPYQASRHP